MSWNIWLNFFLASISSCAMFSCLYFYPRLQALFALFCSFYMPWLDSSFFFLCSRICHYRAKIIVSRVIFVWVFKISLWFQAFCTQTLKKHDGCSALFVWVLRRSTTFDVKHAERLLPVNTIFQRNFVVDFIRRRIAAIADLEHHFRNYLCYLSRYNTVPCSIPCFRHLNFCVLIITQSFLQLNFICSTDLVTGFFFCHFIIYTPLKCPAKLLYAFPFCFLFKWC